MKQILYKFFMKVFHEKIQAEFDRVKRGTTAELEQKIQGMNKANRAISYDNENLKNSVLKLKQDLALKDWEVKKLQEMLSEQNSKPDEPPSEENYDKLIEDIYS